MEAGCFAENSGPVNSLSTVNESGTEPGVLSIHLVEQLCGIGLVLLSWVVTVHTDLEQPWTAIPRYLCLVCTSYGSVSAMVDTEKLGTPSLPTPLDSSDPTATEMMLPFLL